MIRVGMVSLGCSKNQVDAEHMMAALKQAGMKLEQDPAFCDAMIINTCGFIDAAKAESIETILEFSQLKETGNLRVMAVTGCLAERYGAEIQAELPEVDVLLGIGSNQHIVEAIEAALAGGKVVRFGEKTDLSMEGERILANANHFAYLKVAEGCDNRCTYCAIPSIRGAFRSRPIENIIEEAKQLAAFGVKELNLVAQDTTRYGEDLYGALMLPTLLKELCKIPDIQWIRLIYCYPERVTEELIEVLATEEKVVKYIDIPLQHASNRVLKRMNRKTTTEQVETLLATLRQRIPNITIRTTMIAGFPGETEEDFNDLCTFVKQQKFQRLGCFAYSKEEGTPAATFSDQLEEEAKQRRAETVMELQMGISEAFGNSQIGKTLEVLVEDYDLERKCYIGRSTMDAPEVDGSVSFSSTENFIGRFVQVKITGYDHYDFTGEVQA